MLLLSIHRFYSSGTFYRRHRAAESKVCLQFLNAHPPPQYFLSRNLISVLALQGDPEM